ncbi:hypothetical protein [Neobacillus ginsengisoli]|uniref:Uncharacterized protein n=1 Tax=Neobacillus ginsengisoli TaxID=904295 RepID=A0ABT9XYL1_9BACI|nr:hypothetical protein [Neobacillus ginsengisoli]MDQ0200355.1 hypothetical protein [Neobacillus ginsengisoli]
MFSLRGDAHKIFLKLEKALHKEQSIKHIKEFKEIEKVKSLYQSIDSDTLKLIYYRMVKEKNGSGIIPIFVSSIPWLIFMFSNQLSKFLFKEGSRLWLVFSFVYIVALTISVVLHFREKAWAAFHIEIIQDILYERKMQTPRDS